MIVCIPAEKKEDNTHRVFKHLGTAPIYILYDSEAKKIEFIKNELIKKQVNNKTDQPFNLKEKKIDSLIVQNMGESAIAYFNKKGVCIYKAQNQSADANLKALLNGELELFISI